MFDGILCQNWHNNIKKMSKLTFDCCMRIVLHPPCKMTCPCPGQSPVTQKLSSDMQEYKNHYGCEVRIEKSVRGSLFGITRLCWVMPNSDPEGQSFLSPLNNHGRFLFLHTFDLQHLKLKKEFPLMSRIPVRSESWCHMWRRTDIKSQHLNDRVTWLPIRPMYIPCVVFRFLSVPRVR